VEIMTTNEIEFKLAPARSCGFSCDACGHGRAGDSIVCSSDDGYDICPSCLQRGAGEALDADFERRARELEAQAAKIMQGAANLRALIGRVTTLPTFEAWRQANAEEGYEIALDEELYWTHADWECPHSGYLDWDPAPASPSGFVPTAEANS
jgi:hypothetical protein